VKTIIEISDDDRSAIGGRWTANIFDENDDILADPGFGASRRDALVDLLANIDREFPGFSEVD
jgi:molybdopterin biosynthesis enzyme MoaB